MSVDVVLPEVGEGMTEAFIARWHKQVGDRVTEGEPLVEVITDKVNVDLPATATGVLAERRFPEEARVKVGEVIGVIRADG
jgi:2-oxoglutarate dehydrogenase E2 component (dihydrolipoamide succinyltransferase)